ncbi:uncharacterized protein LOC117102075 [Anneissia japonica]|uniref:uncharacterized protein LOC117102075 n=1 Tax=Anneissia japonica TaxID=1529436 RepID=UPI0014257270|nr:uncharacterized protein LOC117102075 [Anneissia japonica]XP_033098185.1 uncharacterized protein LOC117102075 [Anneissia japonica]
MGMPREDDSSWNWESGETVNLLNWGNNQPNLQDSKSAGVYMTTLESYSYVPGKWHDLENTFQIGLHTGSLGYGYICEKSVITTPNLSTTAAKQSFTSGLQSSFTYRRPTIISTTVGITGGTKERTDISNGPFTKANADKDESFVIDYFASQRSKRTRNLRVI